MDKINPSLYITDTDPVDEEVMNSSNWYETQFSSITDGDRLAWLLAQGWLVYQEYTHTTIAYYKVENDDGTTSHVPVTETVPYRWDLIRRVLKPEYALNDLMEAFINAYNTGRQLNDQRYDEIVALFTVMLDKTEDSCISLEAEDTAYDGLVETIISGISSDYDTYEDEVDGIFDGYGDSQRDRINDQFDNELASQRSELKAKGMDNTTVWTSTQSAIERERANALTELEDKILRLQKDVSDGKYDRKTANVRGKVLAARDRLRTMLQSQELERYGLRNQILSALNNFMERREDGYPDLGTIGNLAADLGASQPTYPAP